MPRPYEPDGGIDATPQTNATRYKPVVPDIPPDPWPGLATSPTLEFQDDAAYMCIESCTTALERVLVIRQKVTEAPRPKRYSNLPSGRHLARQFKKKLDNVGELLDGHSKILEEMRETFRIAGKRYVGAEAESAGEFEKLPKIEPGNYNPKPPESGKRKPSSNDHPPIPTSMTSWNGKYDPSTISTENPYMMNYNAFYQLGQNIKPELAADAAALWGWMAQELDDAFDQFTQDLSAASKYWQGEGSDKAQSAGKAYVDNVKGLTTGIRMIADNLDYVSQFLTNTKDRMPTNPNPVATTQSTEWGSYVYDESGPEYLQQYAKVVEDQYTQGVVTANFKMPILLPPASPVTPPGPEVPSPPPTDPGGNIGNRTLNGNTGNQTLNSTPGGIGAGTPNLTPMATSFNAADTMNTPVAASLSEPLSTVPQNNSLPVSSAPITDQTAQQAMQGAQGLAQQAMQGAQGLAASAGQAGLMHNARGEVNAAKIAGPTASKLGAPSGGGGGSGGAKLGGGAAEALAKDPLQSKLFPRASLPANATGAASGIGRAGMAPMSAPGAGAPPASPGAGQGQQRKEHKRAEYLASAEHLKEALGTGLKATKSVLDS